MSITYWQYLVNQARVINEKALEGINSLNKWQSQREPRYKEYMSTMGLDPLPEKCELAVKEYGQFSGKGYNARKLAYQIQPDCWATGHFYLPNPLPVGELPAVLYLSGHEKIGTYGYQEHAIMWARRGYACLIVDSLEQHDNHAHHKGLYMGERYDFISRGYSAATGEIWNGIRALDLLLDMPEVDSDRVGVTGISGGGSYSFFLACADERVKALASIAGIQGVKTNLSGRHFTHACDCSFGNNIYQRDIGEFAALIAPRPALFCYTYEDSLYSVKGYKSIAEQAKKIYELYGAFDKCELFEYDGPHAYKPETVEVVNKWFDKYVAGAEMPEMTVDGIEHDENELTVFNGNIYPDNKLSILPELFTRYGSGKLPQDAGEWPEIKQEALDKLRNKSFPFFKKKDEELKMEQVGQWLAGDRKYLIYRGEMGGMELWLEFYLPPEPSGKLILGVVDRGRSLPDIHHTLGSRAIEHGIVVLETRGFGMSSHHPVDHRFMVRAGVSVGVTETSLQIKDMQAVIDFIKSTEIITDQELYLYGKGDSAVAALYTTLFDETVAGVITEAMPNSHLKGGYIIDILSILDIEHAIGLIAPRPIALVDFDPPRCLWSERAFQRLGCSEKLVLSGSLKDGIDRVLSL